MPLLALSAQECRVLEELLTPLALTTEVRRAQALLWLHEGQSVQVVARRLRVSRQTVYAWAAHFKAGRGAEDISARLADKKRSGRPRTLPRVIDPLIGAVVERDPREFGYHSTMWTAKLLGQYLQEVHHIPVCRASVSLALRRLGKRQKPAESSGGMPATATDWR